MPHTGDTNQLENWAGSPANRGWRSTETLIRLLKKKLNGGTNFTSFQPQSWFWGLSLKTHICSHSTCKGTSFLPKNGTGQSIFLFKSQAGTVEVQVSHGQRFIRDLGDSGATSSPIREVSSQPLAHPAHQSSSYKSVFHLSHWNCPSVQGGLPNQLAREHKKDHNAVTEGRRNSAS